MRALVFIFIISFVLGACGNDSNSKQANQETAKDISPRPELEMDNSFVKVEKERSLATERALAEIKLEKFFDGTKKAPELLTAFEYHIDYKMVVNESKKDEAIEGEWLLFKDDFSYEWFRDHTLSEEGKYYYDINSEILLLRSEHEDHFPSEWKVMNSGNVIVLVGTSTFHNNNTQIHMVGQASGE